jgi:hypothetical protein
VRDNSFLLGCEAEYNEPNTEGLHAFENAFKSSCQKYHLRH